MNSFLGRYTHRIAISNNRIISIKDDNVTFKWRDYKGTPQWII
nr:transposase [Desulfoscipio gibsoniae]